MRKSLVYMIYVVPLLMGSCVVNVEAMSTTFVVVNINTADLNFPVDQTFPKELEYSQDEAYVLVITEKPFLKFEQEINPEYELPLVGAAADTMNQLSKPDYAFSLWRRSNNDNYYYPYAYFLFDGRWLNDGGFSQDGKILEVTFSDKTQLTLDIDTLALDENKIILL